MTGVGKDRSSKLHGADVRVLRVQRPELMLEALPVGSSRSLQSYFCILLPLMPLYRWVEVPFVYKPTSLYQALPMVAPFQPRLDWQMWFAALSSYERKFLFRATSARADDDGRRAVAACSDIRVAARWQRRLEAAGGKEGRVCDGLAARDEGDVVPL